MKIKLATRINEKKIEGELIEKSLIFQLTETPITINNAKQKIVLFIFVDLKKKKCFKICLLFRKNDHE